MKQIIVALTAIIACTWAGCNLDYSPENTMVDLTVYSHEATAEASLLGAYVCLNNFISGAPAGANNYPGVHNIWILGDLGTDNLSAREENMDNRAVETAVYTENSHESLLAPIYRNGYNAIDRANNVIEGIRRYGRYDEQTMNRHVAEARFIRAYAYLQMLILFGDKALQGEEQRAGLVMRLSPYEGHNPDDVQERATNASVWAQIIADLTEPLEHLEQNVPEARGRVRAVQSTSKALLSRVYLYKATATRNAEELRLAARYARDVLQTSAYTFDNDTTAYTVLFPRNLYDEGRKAWTNPSERSSEIIFFQASRLTTDFYPSGVNYYYEKRGCCLSQKLKNLYDDDDVRGYDVQTGGRDGAGHRLIGMGSSKYYAADMTSLKYSSNNFEHGNNDVIYIRLAEMKLTLAEAICRSESQVTDEAVALLNDVRLRACRQESRPSPYRAADFATTDDFLKTLLTERNRELACENHYRYDLTRTGNLLQDELLGAIPSARWNLPLPSYEVRISHGKIKQNSGYLE